MQHRQGGNYTQADPLTRGPASFIAYLSFVEVGRFETEVEAADVVRRAFEGRPLKRIVVRDDVQEYEWA